MSDGKKLIASVLEAGSVQTLRLATEDLFEDNELEVFQFVKTHYRRYGELPDIRTVEQETRARLPAAPEPVEYYIKRLHDRKLFVSLREEFGSLRDALQAFDVDAAKDIVDRMKSACRVSSVDNDLRNVREASRLVMARYLEAHYNPGMSGIPTGWERFDTVLGGYQPGDLVAWIARMGIGKTYIMLKQAIHAWNSGYSVLFVTMEMTIEQIVRRLIGIEAGVNPDFIRKGALTSHGLRRIQRYVETMAHVDRFNVFAGSFSKRVGDLEVLIHELAPDIVFVDGAYLMQPDIVSKGANRIERVASVFDGLKKLTITTERPIVATSQFSRQAGKRGKDGSLETISFSDAIAMHSSLVLSVKEGAPPFEKTRREVEILKGREGEDGKYLVNYRFAPMNFSEVLEEQIEAEAVSTDWMG